MTARVCTVALIATLLLAGMPPQPAAASPWVVTRVGIGNDPQGLVALAQRVFIANAADRTVSVFDDSSSSIIATVRVGRSPRGIAADPETGLVYVANNTDGTLSVIDGTRNTPAVVSTIKLKMEKPSAVAVDSVLRRVFVSHPTKNMVSVVDVSSARPAISRVAVGSGPTSLAVVASGTPSVHKLVVSNTASNTVAVLTTGSGSSATRAPAAPGKVTTCNAPSGLAVDAIANLVYVACGDAGVRSVNLSTREVVHTYAGVAGQARVAIAAGQKKAYAVDNSGLKIIDLVSQKVTSPDVAQNPVAVAADAAGSRVYLTRYAGSGTGELLVIADDGILPSSKILSNTFQPLPSQTIRVGPASVTTEGVTPPNVFPFSGRSTDDFAGLQGVTVIFTSSANTSVKYTFQAEFLSCPEPRRDCTWVVRRPAPPAGAYRVSVRAVDRAGNTEAPGPSATVIVAAVPAKAGSRAGLWGIVGGLVLGGIVAGALRRRRGRGATV
jgi:YVTN family beta-propeller protein